MFSSIYAQSDLDRALGYYKEDRLEASKEILLALYAQNPKNYEVIYHLSNLYFKEANYKESAVLMKKMVDQYPENEEYHFKYGGALGLYIKQHKTKAFQFLDDVKLHMKTAIEINDQYTDAYLGLVQLYSELPSILGGSKRVAENYANILSTYNPKAAQEAFRIIESVN